MRASPVTVQNDDLNFDFYSVRREYTLRENRICGEIRDEKPKYYSCKNVITILNCNTLVKGYEICVLS